MEQKSTMIEKGATLYLSAAMGNPLPRYLVKQQIANGKGNYKIILDAEFASRKNRYFQDRINTLKRDFRGNWFVSKEHQERFENICRTMSLQFDCRYKHYWATLFLVCADQRLFNMIEPHLYRDQIVFEDVQLSSMNTQTYALYRAAKGLADKERLIKFSELSDTYLINKETFTVMIHAHLIEKYGGEVLNTKR